MDKGKRLKLYSQKDYTETIDFPVELVGRDGVVRKYSYADSIRIYERRIESAHVRYGDREVIHAEIDHCSRRLQQIRRSWEQHVYSSEKQYIERRQDSPERELFDHGKVFLMNYVDQVAHEHGVPRSGEPPNLLALEDRDGAQIFYISWPIFYPGALLYVFRTDAPDAQGRKEYEKTLAMLQAVAVGPDTEKLICYELNDRFGFLLTSPRVDPINRIQPNPAHQGPPLTPEPGQPSAGLLLPKALSRLPFFPADLGPLLTGFDTATRVDLESAYANLKDSLNENPYHRDAYWLLAMLAELLDRTDDAEPYLLLALRYFPEDARSYYCYGLFLLRRKSLPKAENAFQTAVKLGIRHPQAVSYLAIALALQSQWSQAESVLLEAIKSLGNDRNLRSLRPTMRRGLWYRRILIYSALAPICLAVSAYLMGRNHELSNALVGLLLFGLATVLAVMVMVFVQYHRLRKSLWSSSVSRYSLSNFRTDS